MSNSTTVDLPRSSHSRLNNNDSVDVPLRYSSTAPMLQRDLQDLALSLAISKPKRMLWGVLVTDIVFAALVVLWKTTNHPLTETSEYIQHITKVTFGVSAVIHILIGILLFAALCIPKDLLFLVNLQAYLLGSIALIITTLVFFVCTILNFGEIDANEKWQQVGLSVLFLALKLVQIVLVQEPLNSCLDILESQQRLWTGQIKRWKPIPYSVRYSR